MDQKSHAKAKQEEIKKIKNWQINKNPTSWVISETPFESGWTVAISVEPTEAYSKREPEIL